MSKKVGEVFEQNGQYFIKLFKEDPIGQFIEFGYTLKSSEMSSDGVFLIPGDNEYEFAEALEKFVAEQNGFRPSKFEIFMIDAPKGIKTSSSK